jgi:hypothetical protein
VFPTGGEGDDVLREGGDESREEAVGGVADAQLPSEIIATGINFSALGEHEVMSGPAGDVHDLLGEDELHRGVGVLGVS